MKKSTVQSIRNAYCKHLASKRLDPQAMAELPLKKRSRPFILVQTWIPELSPTFGNP